MAFAWCHDPNLANDLIQEANSKALERSGQLHKLEAFDAWVFRILANCCKDHYRCRRNIVALHEWGATAQHEVTPEYNRADTRP
jgi:RNA polymerase sigma-70 factor (ECF subfamily)